MPRVITTQAERKARRSALRPAVIDPNQNYYIEESAVAIGISRNHVFRKLRAGEIKGRKIGRRTVISGREIIRFNSANT
jgi:hypothetical protein